MNLPQLRAFDAVARYGSFSAAAQALGVSQPAVTQQIKLFEEALGSRLFRRGASGIALTAQGADLLPRVRQAVLMLDDLGERVGAGRSLRRGFLTVGICAPFIAMPAIRRFMADHPGIRVEVQADNTARLLDGLSRHRIDVAVVTLPEPSPDLLCEALVEQRVLVVVPADHPWRGTAKLHPEQLHGQPFVLREHGSMTRQLFEKGLAAAGASVEEALTLSSREAMKEAVAQGIAPGIVLDRELGCDPRLVGIAVDSDVMRAHECVVTLPDLADLGPIRAFREVARATFVGDRERRRVPPARVG